MLARPHIVIRLLELLQLKRLLVNYRLQHLRVRLNRFNHLFQLDPAARKHRSRRKHLRQAPLEAHFVFARPASQEADDGDDAAHTDGLDALLHLVDAGNLDNDFDAAAAGEFLRRLAPFAVVLVVDDVVGAEFLQGLDFAGRSGGGNDPCAGGFGKLQSKDAHAAGALDKDPLAGLDNVVEGSI